MQLTIIHATEIKQEVWTTEATTSTSKAYHYYEEYRTQPAYRTETNNEILKDSHQSQSGSR